MESIVSATSVVHFDKEAYKALNSHLANSSYSRIFVLVDENTHLHCLPLFLPQVETEVEIEIIEIESGEIHKNIHTCTQVWEALSELGADRKSLMVNLGGGVITDLGGFVACAFKRGIDFINVPTTLLSMVDASVGGKTGVDLGPLKNQIGIIEQPEMVMVIPDFLHTLEKRQLLSGFAEMLKHGLIQNEDYWNALKELTTFDSLDKHIHTSVTIKNEVVKEDPREHGIRKILNFGHTLGHAIESYFLESKQHDSLLHGEAISVGMVLEAYLSNRLTGLPDSQLEDIKNTFLERYRKVEFSNSDIEAILNLLKFDKKNSHGNINFVLLNSIGDPAIDCAIPEELFSAAFAYYAE